MNSKIFLSVFITLIMVSSIIGYMFSGSEEVVKYGGYKFTQVEGNWVANINKQKVFVSERPDLLVDLSMPKLSFNYLNSMDKIYLSLNPEDKLDSSLYLFNLNILSKLKPTVVRSCTADSDECRDLPLKSCEDASSSAFIIVLKRGEKKVSYENNCLIIVGGSEEILKYLDKLTLDLLI